MKTAHYHKPARIGYRVYVVKDRSYKHLHMELREGFRCNAARDYELTGEQHSLELAKNLREATGTTEYLNVGCSSETKAELRWQSHQYSSDDYAVRDNPENLGKWADWYALKIDDCSYDAATLSMLTRILRKADCESMYNMTPQAVIEAIKSLKGFAVNYGQRCETWIGDWYLDGEGSVDLLDPNYSTDRVCV